MTSRMILIIVAICLAVMVLATSMWAFIESHQAAKLWKKSDELQKESTLLREKAEKLREQAQLLRMKSLSAAKCDYCDDERTKSK